MSGFKDDLIGARFETNRENYNDGYSDGYSDGYVENSNRYNEALDDLVAELENIDDCEFASYTLCLIKELVEKLKDGDI